MNLDNIFNNQQELSEPKSRCIVRIRTSTWSDRTGFHYKKDVIYLRRKSEGHNFLQEDVANGGADCVIERSPEFLDLKDGIYEVYTINEKKDYWTGFVEDYDYAFKPFIEK